MIAFILAQGENSRWRARNGKVKLVGEFPPYKHMIPMGKYGAPNIARTKIMMRTHGYIGDLVSIARHEASAGGNNAELGEPTGPILQTVAMCAPSPGRIIILLGDVVYSHSLIDAILDDMAKVRFYGRIGPNKVTKKQVSEIFALAIEDEWKERVVKACEGLIRRGGLSVDPKLWHLYFHLNGIDIDEVPEDKYINEDMFYHVDDYTDDIDSVEEFSEFYMSLNTEAAHDDAHCRCDLRRSELFP